MDRHNVKYNILCVVSWESARRARRMWNFIIREGIEYIEFIPCLEALETPAKDKPLPIGTEAALTSKRFGQFYSELFPLWKAEAEKGNLVHVRYFEDIAGLYLAGQGLTCGMSGRCSPQIVVEADGGVYPCDFYVLDEYRVANLAESPLEEVYTAVATSGFLSHGHTKYTPCVSCTYNKWCQGGCKRMTKAVYGNDCGMKSFLDKHLRDLLGVAQKQLRA